MAQFHWIPNALTLTRFVIAVTLPWSPAGWQFTMLVLAAVTELLDGWLSRWLAATSAFGQLFDPIADKTLILTAVCLALRNDWLSGEELIGLVSRDLVVLAFSARALLIDRRNWRRLKPRLSGKIATSLQLLALLALFWTCRPMPLLVWPAAAISAWAAIDYARHAYFTPQIVPLRGSSD